MRRVMCFGVSLVMAMVSLVSCNGKKIYDSYSSTPLSGWEKNDTLSYSVPPIDTAAVYHTMLGLRTTADYPFTSITLIVEQHVYPSDRVVTDTVRCLLTDAKGNTTGKGVSFHQYQFPIGSIVLQTGDSVHVRIRHDMKREILPGISDVGYMMEKE